MQIEVLRYIHQDYEVIVRTQDINYSWEKFKGRINYTRKDNPEIDAPEEYCRYTSKDECRLRLYSPVTGETLELNDKQPAKEWDKIEYEKVPGKAFNLYKNAFEKHDYLRFLDFV